MKTLEATPLPAVDLPDHRQKQVEAGVAQFQAVLAERDELSRQLRDTIVRNDSLQQQLTLQRGAIEMMQTNYQKSLDMLEHRVTDATKQRDDAVAHAVSLEAVLANIHVITRNVINGSDASTIGEAS